MPSASRTSYDACMKEPLHVSTSAGAPGGMGAVNAGKLATVLNVVGGAASSSAGGCGGGAAAVPATPAGNSYVKRTADDVAEPPGVAAYVTASTTITASAGAAAVAYVHDTPAYAPIASAPASGCARSSTQSDCNAPPDRT
jgi:hypothetical protein